jgi:mRNA interferase MazF
MQKFGIVNAMKDFPTWMKLKEKLDGLTHQAPLVTEGDMWWASIGENVGSEIGGKNHLFSRPVIILKKLAHGFYFVIPTTSKEKSGTWYIPFKHKGKDMAACLHQARSIDHRRLSSKLGTLDAADFERVKKGFHSLYK